MPQNKSAVTYREIIAIALPVVVSHATETVMMFVDRLFLSNVSLVAMSAAMSGGVSSFVFQSFFIGLLGYTNALVAQYYGANKLQRGIRSVTQGLYLSAIAAPFTLLLIPAGRLSFIWAGHSPLQFEQEYAYFSILMFGSILAYLRTTLSGFFIGIGKTRIVLIANALGMVINIPLNFILIFGKLGLPAMGIRGAALGTLGGALCSGTILFLAYLHSPEYKKHRVDLTWKFNRHILGSLLRFGVPAGVEMFLNLMAFNISLQLFYSYGIGVASAVTIAFNYDIIAFIPMMGLSFATTSIVGKFMGAGDPETAEKAGFKAWKLSLMYGLSLMGFFVFGAKTLVNVFSSQFGPEDGEYLELARKMIQLLAAYTLADMTQLIFAGALRGAGDTRWVMWTSVILHWLYAGMAILLIPILQVPPLTVWLFFIGFVFSMSVAMTMRYLTGAWKAISLVNETEKNYAKSASLSS